MITEIQNSDDTVVTVGDITDDTTGRRLRGTVRTEMLFALGSNNGALDPAAATFQMNCGLMLLGYLTQRSD